MRHLNGVYTQAFNKHHRLVGHLFQGRFKAILVDAEPYLLTLLRYVELNPVRAQIVSRVQDWPWSSYAAMTGAEAPPPWFQVDCVHAQLLQRPPRSASDHARAAQAYASWVADGDPKAMFWVDHLRQQIYLGGEDFVARMQALAEAPRLRVAEVASAQRRSGDLRHPLAFWLAQCGGDRAEALRLAYQEPGCTLEDFAQQIGLSAVRVGQLVLRAEQRLGAAADDSARAPIHASYRPISES
jgi:hypothetical protein